MIDANILRILMRTAPNYHIVADGVARKSSVCVCSRCANSCWNGDRGRQCQTLANRLRLDEYPIGYARVDGNGTCDRAFDRQLKLNLDGIQAEQPEPSKPEPTADEPDFRMEGEVSSDCAE